MTQGLRERKKTEVRAQLVASAFRLIQARGFDAVTVSEIAADAGVSPATFFRYFGSKEEVAFGEAGRRLDDLRRHLAAVPQTLPPLAALREAIVSLARDLEADPEVRHRLRLILEHDGLRARLDHTMAEWSDALAEDLGGRVGSRSESTLLTSVALAVLRASLPTWVAEGTPLVDLVRAGFHRLCSRSIVLD